MSFKELGTAIKQIQELNKGEFDPQNDQYKSWIESFNRKDISADKIRKQMDLAKADDTFKQQALFDIANTNKEAPFSKDDAQKEIDLIKAKASSGGTGKSDLSKVASEAQNAKEALSDLGQVNLDNVNSSASSLGNALKTGVTSGLGKAKAGLLSFGSSVKAVFSGIGASIKANLEILLPLLAIWGTVKAATGVYENLRSQRKDELGAGQKNLDKYNKKINKNADKVKQTKKLQDEFNTLSAGVDSHTNENIGLTTSQYERYLEVKKQLVKLNGDLVTGYNSEGEALINNNTAIQDTIDKYQKLADENKKEIANKKNVGIQNDAMALNVEKAKYGSGLTDESIGTNAKRILPITFRSAKNLSKEGLGWNNYQVQSSISMNEDFKKQAKKILGDNVDVDKLTSKQIYELSKNSDSFSSKAFGGKNDTKNLKKLLEAQATNYEQLEKYSDSFRKNTLSNISQAVDGYEKLDKTTKTFASNFISNMDIDPEKMLDTDYLEKQEQTVENLTKKLTQSKDVQNQIKDFQKDQVNTNMNANDWQKTVNEEFNNLSKSTGISKKTLALTLGIKLDDKDNVLFSTGKNIAKMQEELNNTFKNQDISKFTDSLSLNDLANAYDIVTDKTNIFTGSVDQLKERLKMLKSSAADAAYTVEGYKAAVDTADDDANYNTIVSGMKQTKEDYDKGKVGTDQFKTFAGMISPTGKTDADNFKENYDHIKKYFTEDNSGVYTFFDDLKAKTNDSGKALAEFDKKTQKWKINIDSTASAAKKFGMGVEPFEALLNNLKTYGFDVNFDSLTEQYDKANEKLDGWAKQWQEQGGSVGDKQGQRIEAWRQQISQAKEIGAEIPDTWTKVIDFEVNIASLQSGIEQAKTEYGAAQLNGDTKAQQKSVDKQLENSAQIQYKLTEGKNVGEAGLTKDVEIPVKVKVEANNIQSEIQGLTQQYQSATGEDKIKIGLKIEAKREELLRELQPYLDPKTMKIVADNMDAKKKAKETKSEADKVPDTKKTTYTADSSDAKQGAKEAQDAINSVEDEHITQIKTQYGIGKNGKVSQKTTQEQVRNNYLGNTITQIGNGAYSQPKQTKASNNGGSKSDSSNSGTSTKTETTTVKVDVKGNAKKTIDSIKQSLSSMESKSISINIKGSAKKTISSISSALKKLKSKSVSIKVKGGANTAVNKIVNALKKVKSKTASVKVKDGASSKINSVKNKLNSLGKMHPTPQVTINTSGLPDVKTAASTISGLHDKTVNVSVNYKQSGSAPTGGTNGSHGTASFAHGSTAWSRAFAQGTISDLTDFDGWDGEAFTHGSVKILSSRALAMGHLGAKGSGKTLVGELGPEMRIPAGSDRWELLGTMGPEFTDVHSGDIIFNHQQTADLLSNGHTSTHASVKGGMSAFAHGTAYATGHRVTGSGAFQGGAKDGYAKHSSGSSSSSGTTHKNTEATKRNTKAKDNDTNSTKKNTKSKKTALERFVDKLGTAFDFVAIKIDRAAAATEAFANKINDYVSSGTKTKALWNEYKSTGKEITTNQKAAKKYKSYANSIERNAIAKAPGSGKTKTANQKKLRSYFKQVRNGSLNISTIKNDNMRSVVESYQQYYEKMLDCNKAAQQLKNTQRDLFNQWLNMPTEKAQKAIENLQNSYDTLSNRSSAASTGESGVARLVRTSNDQLSEAQSNVSSAKSTQSRASSSNKTAQKKVSKATKSQKSKAKSATKAVKKSGLSKKKKASLNKSIKAGKTISTKGLKGSAKKKAIAYNKAVKSTKSAKSSAAKTSANLSNANSALYDAQVYLKNVQDSQAIASNYAGQPAYAYQNDVLDSQVKNKKKQYENSQTAVKEASKNQAKYQKERENAEANKNKADSAVKTKGNNILKTKRAKKLSNSQKNAIKSGKEVSLKGIKDKTLLKQLKAYNAQVKKAKDASNKLAQAKQKEADATNALATANKNANDAAADWAAEQTNAAVQSQANIKAYYDAKANMEATNSSNASSAAKLKQSKGQDLDSSDYQNQIDANERQAQIIDEEAAKMQENLNNKLNDGSIKYGSQEWMQMQNEINACKGSADDLRASNEELKNSMRDDIYYRGFERAIKTAQNLQNSLTTISSLIDEDAMFDDDGNLTDYGTAAIATNIANVRSEKEELNQLMQERAKMAEHRDEYSDTEWADAIQKSDQDIADAVKSIKSAEDSVTTILKNNAKQKLDVINKTIDAYSEAIKKSNDYYTYDKQLKSSNKDIQILKSQINALNGVADAASKSKKARLEAELQEKQDALDDTVKDHIYNLQIDGLDKLTTHLNDDYEKYCKELSSSVDKIEETFTSLSGTISSEGAKIDSTITTILGHYGVKPRDLGLTDSKVTGYAQGGLVKSVHKNGDDGLASLAVGEEVATVDVVNLANKVRQDKVLNALANGHTLNGMTMDGIGTTEINVNFGEAIGAINVPSGVSKEELQRIVNESYKYTSQKVTRDMAKIVGRKRPV